MQSMTWSALAVLGVLAAAPAAAQSIELKSSDKPKREKNVLTADEIAERQGIISAYDAVKLLRPQFLKRSWTKGALGSSAEGGGFSPGPGAGGVDLKPPSRDGGLKPEGETPTYTSGRKAGSGTDALGNPKDSENTGYAVLYVNEVKQRSLDDLKTIRASEVLEIQFVSASQAAVRFGPGHESGALLLKTQPAKP